MEKILEFINSHGIIFSIIGLVASGLITAYLPKTKFYLWGNKLHDKIPEPLIKKINERIDAFQEGLVNSECNGCTDIISNEKLIEETVKLKKELGLGK